MRNGVLFVIVANALLSVVLSSQGCSSTVHPRNENTQLIAGAATPECQGISSEAAALIAKGYLFLSYELKDRKVIVETESELYGEHGEHWRVTFVDTTATAFGNPSVWISKKTGEVFTVRHAK